MRGLAREWVYIPVAANSKKPIEKGWQNRKHTSENEIRRWVAEGHNVGISCGPSGLVVVDIDPGAPPSAFELPDTVEVSTPRGGRHKYYEAPEDVIIKNSVSNVLPYVDVRGVGGQVVAVGSTIDEQRYLWEVGCALGEADLVPLPEVIIEHYLKKELEGAPKPEANGSFEQTPGKYSAWAKAALGGIMEDLQLAVKGKRNDSLNRLAFKAGQLIEAGGLNEEEVRLALYTVAVGIGLGEREVNATISSGFNAGKDNPRYPKDKGELPITTAESKLAEVSKIVGEQRREQADRDRAARVDLLVPGKQIDKDGILHDVTFTSLAADLLKHSPEGTFVRRMGEIGAVSWRGQFMPYTATSILIAMEKVCDLWEWVKDKRKGQWVRIPRLGNRTIGQGVIDAMNAPDAETPELEMVTQYPVLTTDYKLSPPGLHDGIFVADSSDVEIATDKEAALEILDEAVSDFPFHSQADRDNFLALLFTPLLRPLIDCVPIFSIGANQERTGKTLLAQGVMGNILYRRGLPTMTWPEGAYGNEELSKILTSLNREGASVVLFDNLPTGVVRSSHLAKTATSTVLRDRILGQTGLTEAPNRFTIVLTGNNVRFTGELAKRMIPIRLAVEGGELPEERGGWKHSMLRLWVQDNRRTLLGALLGLVRMWASEDAPKALAPQIAGFESWVANVGGIVSWCGREALARNREEWLRDADDEAEELVRFVSSWTRTMTGAYVNSDDLIIHAEDVWLDVGEAKNSRGAAIRLGKRLKGHVGRTIRMPDGQKVRILRRRFKGATQYMVAKV